MSPFRSKGPATVAPRLEDGGSKPGKAGRCAVDALLRARIPDKPISPSDTLVFDVHPESFRRACSHQSATATNIRSSATYLIGGTTAARPGLVEVAGGTLSHAAAHRGSGVAHSWHATRRSPWRGEAQEGSAQLKVALPSSSTAAQSDRGERTVWDASSSAHCSDPLQDLERNWRRSPR